ncbi:MAG: nucleotidyltransferase family protein [Pyrinomonadaceae bacterium]
MRDEEKPDSSRSSSLISHPYIAAILLAAGRSRRMGAFKPLLTFGQSTVIESCINNLREGGVERIVVVTGHRGDQLRERLAHLPLSFAVNEDAESEMSVSIARGVERLHDETEALFVALCDQPAVEPWVLRLLIDERAATGARLVVPEYEGRGGHPVLLDSDFREELMHLDPQRGLRELFDAHREEVRRVPVASAYVARDMDTWEDYVALHEEVLGFRPPDQRARHP